MRSLAFHCDFNPTLVRLARRPLTLASRLGQHFNPTLVRLAPIAFGVRSLRHVDFNPTLVRLALPEFDRSCNLITIFQSHLGSISTDSRIYS